MKQGKIDHVIQFLQKEIVLTVSILLACISALAVYPDEQYVSYIDYRTLSILLSLMLVMAGFKSLGVFREIGESLAAKTHSARGLVLVLTALCFFASMIITNDVSLITFVPFTIITLDVAKKRELLIPAIVFETIAANLGSMATPIGNPQNLYLYSLAGLSMGEFLSLMLPYTTAAGLGLILAVLVRIKKDPIGQIQKSVIRRGPEERRRIIMYVAAFGIELLVVMRVLDYRAGLLAVLIMIILLDRKRFFEADYSLIFTFIFLFIFIGNMKRIPMVSSFLGEMIVGHEVLAGVLLSQIISNVPAAILCSGFTTALKELIIGVNIGGLGTLIASMASLISFKQYSNLENTDRGKYLFEFTIWNLLFLIVMGAVYCVLNR